MHPKTIVPVATSPTAATIVPFLPFAGLPLTVRKRDSSCAFFDAGCIAEIKARLFAMGARRVVEQLCRHEVMFDPLPLAITSPF